MTRCNYLLFVKKQTACDSLVNVDIILVVCSSINYTIGQRFQVDQYGDASHKKNNGSTTANTLT